MHPLYEIVANDLENDLKQMLETGHDRSALEAELAAVKKTGSLEALTRLQEEWWNRPSPANFPYEEPSDWPTIQAGFPQAESHARFKGGEAELADRLLAAWRGRCAGCQLGKPLEGTTWPDKIRKVLETVGSWPLTDYMNPTPEGVKIETLKDCAFFDAGYVWRKSLCKGNFDHVAPDDDIHYAIISQMLLEEKGPEFTTQDAADHLLQKSGIWPLWAAGRNMWRTTAFGIKTPYTAVMGNPCRQSLGAMIRCDPFGWGAPANPALAARMAYQDAAGSQVRNGIYSGIFFTTLMADTLAQGDAVKAIATATAYVPPRSRFAEMLRLVREWCAATDDWQDVNRKIIARWPEESQQFNHSIPNAAIVLTGLLLGRGDFTRTLGITVMGGLDTDCTGATVGSIMGCALGMKGIPAKWYEPFHDTIQSDVRGLATVKITELARRMCMIAKKNTRWSA